MKTTAEKFLAGVVSVVLALALVGLVACGEDDDDDEDSQRVVTAAAIASPRMADRIQEEQAAAAEAARLQAEAAQKALEAPQRPAKRKAVLQGHKASTKATRSRKSGGAHHGWVDPNCESGGNPQAKSKSGKYWGTYQYEKSAWIEDGGKPEEYGNPNTSAERQREVASNAPFDRWPNC